MSDVIIKVNKPKHWGPAEGAGRAERKPIGSDLRIKPENSIEQNLDIVIADMNQGFDRSDELDILSHQITARQTSRLRAMAQDETLSNQVRAKFRALLDSAVRNEADK